MKQTKDIRSLAIKLGYELKGNAPFQEVVEAGAKEVENLISTGVLTRKLDRYSKVSLVEYDGGFIKKTYPILKKPPLDRRDDYYLIRRSEILNKGLRRKEYVKPTYIFKQSKQPKSIIEILRKQNNIAFTTWRKVLDFERTNKSQVYDETWKWETAMKQQAVELIQDRTNKKFFTAHQFDTRGRIYPTEYFLNYQADEWGKASVTPIVPTEQLTLRGFRALKIDLANHYGLDKVNYDDRVSAVENNTLPAEAKKPILATKAKEALDKAYKTKATDYSCSIDATASGLQILAILANCEETAKLTNLTDISNCYDLYQKIAEDILAKSKNICGVTAKDIRKEVKASVMQVSYNSDQAKRELYEFLQIKKVNINSSTLCDTLEVSHKISKAKGIINNLLCDTFNDLPSSEQIARFTMPDGFIVELPNIQKAMANCNSRYFQLNIMYDILGWNKELNWRGLIPNIIQSIDAYICRELIRRCNFTIITIHDSFSCHPNHIDELRINYLTILKEIQQMNMLEYIGKQINPNFSYKPEGELFDIVIDKDSYALC